MKTSSKLFHNENKKVLVPDHLFFALKIRLSVKNGLLLDFFNSFHTFNIVLKHWPLLIC